MIDFIAHTGFVDLAFVVLIIAVGFAVIVETARRKQLRDNFGFLKIDDDLKRYLHSLRDEGTHSYYRKAKKKLANKNG